MKANAPTENRPRKPAQEAAAAARIRPRIRFTLKPYAVYVPKLKTA